MLEMARKLSLSFVAGMVLIATPVAAQEAVEGDDIALTEAFSELFPVEPLTAEQAVRLPQAQAVIARIMPPGIMQDMMGGMFNSFLGPIMEAGQNDPASVISERFGYDMTSSPEAAAEVAAILDPAWGERRRREAELMPQLMAGLMAGMEPAMRSVMAEMYAIHFNAEELAGIDAFFATPIGASYARKSFSMTSDPRLMGAMMQSMPEMMGDMGEIEAEIAAATADLPPARGYADLSEGERARLAELLGLTAEDLEWQLNPALWEEEYPADGAMIEHSDDHDYGPAPTEAASGSTPVAKQPL